MGLFSDIGAAIGTPQALKMQEAGMHHAQDVQRDQYKTDKGYYQPYYDVGTGALQRLNGNLNSGAYNVNVTPQNLSGDPGYQFQLQQGQQALERSAAAHGGLMSGGFMKSLDNYSQGLASTQYQNAWNRQFQQNQFNYNSLANMAGVGERAAGNLAGLGQNYGNTQAGLFVGLGNARAAAKMGQSQAIGSSVDGGLSLGLDIAGAAGGMPGLGGGGGGGGGNYYMAGGPSASSQYAANPGGYSLGYGGGGQSMGGIGYADAIPQQPGYGGGGYSLGNYGGQLIPPQMGGGY